MQHDYTMHMQHQAALSDVVRNKRAQHLHLLHLFLRAIGTSISVQLYSVTQAAGQVQVSVLGLYLSAAASPDSD